MNRAYDFKNKLLGAGYAILVFALLLTNVNCGRRTTIKEINFKETIELNEVDYCQVFELNICVGSMITPEEGYAYYKKLLDYIGRKLNMKVNFIEKRTYGEVNTLLKDGIIDVAFVCGGPYIEGHDKFGLELLVAPLVNGKALYYSYIIVAKDSGIERIEDLKGKTFAFVDPLSNTGKLIPTYILHKLGQSPEDFFKESLYTYSHDDSIKAVAHGIVDGAAVDSLIWDYMDKKNGRFTGLTKIINISEPYGIPPVVTRPGMDGELKAKIKHILLDMHTEKEGRDILKGMFIDKFTEIDDTAYDSIRAVKKSINA